MDSLTVLGVTASSKPRDVDMSFLHRSISQKSSLRGSSKTDERSLIEASLASLAGAYEASTAAPTRGEVLAGAPDFDAVFTRFWDKKNWLSLGHSASKFSLAPKEAFEALEAPEDVEVDVEVTLEEIFTEVWKEIRFDRKEFCDTRKFSSVASAQKTLLINPRILSQKTRVFKGEGHRGARGVGDLVVRYSVAPNERFWVKGLDLFTKKRVKLAEIILARHLDIPHIDGKVVRVGLEGVLGSGAEVVVKGEGFRGNSGEVRDLVVVVEIEFPEFLSEEKKLRVKEILG